MFSFPRALPEETGISSRRIADVLKRLNDKNVPMHALLIARHGKLIFEKYYEPYTSETLHRMFSISKTFTALAIEKLSEEGRIRLDDPICQYFPEYVDENTHPYIQKMTIRNMLEMRTCHASTTYKVDMTSDWVKSFFTTPPTHKPGTIFHYDTSSSHTLAALVEKLTGMKMLDYLRSTMLDDLGFSQDAYMVTDPFGVSLGGSGLMALPIDILKIVYLLHCDGQITLDDGLKHQLLDPDFVKRATSNISDSLFTAPVPSEAQGYGMFIWQNEKGGFVLYGMGGQLGISIPSKDLIIMTCADTQTMAGGNQIIYDSIYEYLLPYIDKDPLPIDVSEESLEYELLTSYAEHLHISMPHIDEYRPERENRSASKDLPQPVAIDGRFYKLDPNKSGFTSLRIDGSADRHTLTLSRPSTTNHFEEELLSIEFGTNGTMCTGSFPVYGTTYTAGALYTRENVLFILVHLIGESVGSIRMELYFDEDEHDITVLMLKKEETYFNEYHGHFHGVLVD